jgi:catechol 2,3-dioxygenase-like lactoylglutathione lyase family enzyme
VAKISHIELSVSNYKKSIQFYDKVLIPLGFERCNCTEDFTAFSNGNYKIILCPTEEKFKEEGYHRKRTGLNHLAFSADSKEDVDHFVIDVLNKNKIKTLYEKNAFGDEDYYAAFFEDPDRIKLELVYAPKYCDKDSWPTNIEDSFDPYSDLLR